MSPNEIKMLLAGFIYDFMQGLSMQERAEIISDADSFLNIESQIKSMINHSHLADEEKAFAIQKIPHIMLGAAHFLNVNPNISKDEFIGQYASRAKSESDRDTPPEDDQWNHYGPGNSPGKRSRRS